MKKLALILLLTSLCFAQKTSKVIVSFNSGELSPLMDARIDQAKYLSGCRTMENYIPLIYGAAQRRTGTEYIAGCKSNSAKSRLVAFEHSVDDTYILEFANQVIRVFRDGGRVLTGSGSEDLSALDNIIAHWTLNDDAANTAVVDDDGATHDGVASTNTEDITAEGKVGTGCFDLDGTYAVSVTDHADFTFVEGVDGDFTIAGWIHITEAGVDQTILSKWDETYNSQAREWKLLLDDSRKLEFSIADESLLLDSDLIAHWKLNDSLQTSVVIDADGATHNGTLVDGDNDYTSDHSVASKSGSNMVNAFDFDGDDYITMVDHADFSFDDSSDEPFSISAWVYVTDTAGRQTILSKWLAGTGKREWQIGLLADETIAFEVYDDVGNDTGNRTTDAALSTGWRHVVAVYDNADASWSGATALNFVTLYVDGSSVASTAANDAQYLQMRNDSAKCIIGAIDDGASQLFQDKLDNIMLLSKALSSDEVTALYSSGNGIEELNTVYPSAITDDALSIGWRFVVVTYEGENGSWSGATAADYVVIYVDGAAVNVTATNLSTYSTMEDTSAAPRIGAQESNAGAIEKIWADKIDNIAMFGDVLSSSEVAALYDGTAIYEITTPYLTADLFELKFEQSADVMYIVHPDYEQRKLSRTGHDDWEIQAIDLRTGPYRTQNTTISFTITPSATTGSITLTAAGGAPFVSGTTTGHLPSGSTTTSKSQTGALFKIVHATGTPSVAGALITNSLNATHTALAVPKGVTWDFTTNGTWGTAGDAASIVLERSYDSGTTYETIITVTSAANKNVTTSGTEEVADATYRARVSEAGGDASVCSTQLSVRDTSHIGIVEITAVASPISATATVLTTLGSTDLTHRWSEGSFSNYRGWPIDITISAEERLTFTGNKAEPLTTWGSESGDFTNFAEGTNDSDPIQFTLVGTGQQNRIRWVLSKDVLIMGTVGGEHLLGASRDDEALTPTNVRARLQTTHGSKDIAALTVNQAILFVQRGGLKIRELLYNFESDSYKADDLTVFSNHITESGIVDMDYQRTPDPMLWCVRDDGEIAVMSYEREQNVFSWSRFVTSTNAGGSTTTDSDYESVAVIYGGAGNEDEVWVTIERIIDSNTVRYVERFFQRAMPSDMDDMKYLDSFLTYDSTATTTITGLSHLEGETVQVLGDGLVQATKTVSGGSITIATSASTVQVGLGYTSTLKPMKLDIGGTSLTTTKRINRAVVNLFETIQSEIGPSTSKLNTIKTGTAALFTGSKEVSLKGGYSREGDILLRQTDPLPSTILSLNLDVGQYGD